MQKQSAASVQREMLAQYARWLHERQERSRFVGEVSIALSAAVALASLQHTFQLSWLDPPNQWPQYLALALLVLSILLAGSMWQAKSRAALSTMQLIALKIELGEAAEDMES